MTLVKLVFPSMDWVYYIWAVWFVSQSFVFLYSTLYLIYQCWILTPCNLLNASLRLMLILGNCRLLDWSVVRAQLGLSWRQDVGRRQGRSQLVGSRPSVEWGGWWGARCGRHTTHMDPSWPTLIAPPWSSSPATNTHVPLLICTVSRPPARVVKMEKRVVCLWFFAPSFSGFQFGSMFHLIYPLAVPFMPISLWLQILST